MSKKDEEVLPEESKTLKENEDHAANEAAAETPVVADARRDGNGALIVN